MKTPTLLALTAVLAASAAFAGTAQARERHTAVSGPNGKTATRDVVRARGDVQSTTTGPNGGTTSRSVERSASGTTATVTGPKGQSVTRTTTRQQ